MKQPASILGFALTIALLACNGKKESHLDTFYKINQSLPDNRFRSKRSSLENLIDSLYHSQPDKHRHIYDISSQLKSEHDSIYNYIDDLKRELLLATEKAETSQENKEAKTTDVCTEIMLNKGKVKVLKLKVNAYRELLVNYCADTACTRSIRDLLNTTDIKTTDGIETWESMFYEIPLAAIITNLSKTQSAANTARINTLESLINNKQQ